MYAIVKKDATYGVIKSGKTFISDVVVTLKKGDVYKVTAIDYRGKEAYSIMGENVIITAMPNKLDEYFDFIDRPLTWREKRRCQR